MHNYRMNAIGGIVCFILGWVLSIGGNTAIISAQDKPEVTGSDTGVPALSMTNNEHGDTIVSAEFPGLPGQIFDAWCYEGPRTDPWVFFVSSRKLDGGRMEMTHRFVTSAPYLVVTTVVPQSGAVEFIARAYPDTHSGQPLPDSLRGPNICFQVQHAPMFSSQPDPYPEFMKRCFIFTAQGQTFLHLTQRTPTWHPPQDRRNNPPWVQRYLQVGAPAPGLSGGRVPTNTTDRFITPVNGIVSRDGRYLAALGNNSSKQVLQMWFDCLHNNPAWLPADVPAGQRTWRLKYYVMTNEPDKLLRIVAEDFPAR